MGRRAGTFLAGLALACSVLLVGTSALGDGHGSRTRVFGHSVLGRSLTVRRTGTPHAGTRVMVVGVIHGNETAGLPIVRRLRHIPSRPHVKYFTVLKLNPDGVARDTRQNAHGVDLNRNFPRGWQAQGDPGSTYYSGPSPASEPETRAGMRLIRRVRPDVTIWYHQHLNIVDHSLGSSLRIVRRYAHVARMHVDRIPLLPGTATRWENGKWPADNAFVVELPAGSLSHRAVRRHVRAVKAVGRLVAG